MTISLPTRIETKISFGFANSLLTKLYNLLWEYFLSKNLLVPKNTTSEELKKPERNKRNGDVFNCKGLEKLKKNVR